MHEKIAVLGFNKGSSSIVFLLLSYGKSSLLKRPKNMLLSEFQKDMNFVAAQPNIKRPPPEYSGAV